MQKDNFRDFFGYKNSIYMFVRWGHLIFFVVLIYFIRIRGFLAQKYAIITYIEDDTFELTTQNTAHGYLCSGLVILESISKN